MKNKILLICFFLAISTYTCGQSYDTITTYSLSDSLTYESEDYESEYDTGVYETQGIAAAYTVQDPALLPVTQANNKTTYAEHNFNKTKWKEIVGETNYAEEKVEEEAANNSVSSPSPVWTPAFLKFLGFGFLFALAIVILYFLVKNTFADEAISKNTSDADSLLFDNQHIDDVAEQDIDVLLKRALALKDFRGAIRLYYIRLLKHLHNTNYISWKRDKTNRDYASELMPTTFVHDFRKITLAYEIAWYGERTPSYHEFELLQKNFVELHEKTSAIPA